MSQASAKKRPFLSPRAQVILGLSVILFFVVISFFLPPEGDSTTTTGDSIVTPTVSITNLVGTLTVNRSVDLQGVHITVTNVQEAKAFSNDRKRAGNYTVRVNVHTSNSGQTPIGLDYASQIRLLLPNGQVILPKYLTVPPVVLPNRQQNGSFDFPVPTQVDLSSLVLRLGNSETVVFAG